jgi:ferric-dicitrate binding protein FerR (iron transport regulator)
VPPITIYHKNSRNLSLIDRKYILMNRQDQIRCHLADGRRRLLVLATESMLCLLKSTQWSFNVRCADGRKPVGRILRSEARLAVNVEIFATRIFLRAGGQARRRRADAGTSLKRDVKAPWYLTDEKLKG